MSGVGDTMHSLSHAAMQAYHDQVIRLWLEELPCFCRDCKAAEMLSQAVVGGAGNA